MLYILFPKEIFIKKDYHTSYTCYHNAYHLYNIFYYISLLLHAGFIFEFVTTIIIASGVMGWLGFTL